MSSKPPIVDRSVEQALALAIGHVNVGERDRAKEICLQLTVTSPPHPAVQQLLAVILLQEGDCEAAAQTADASLALRPGHAPTMRIAGDAWFELSLKRHAQRNATGELQALREALRHTPGRVEAEVNLGLALQERGEIDEAMRAYGRAYRMREDTFGRIAHALASADTGRMWLRLDDLRVALLGAPP